MTAHPRWSFNISQALCNGTRDFSRGSCSIFPIHRCAGPGPVLDGSAQPARNGVFFSIASAVPEPSPVRGARNSLLPSTATRLSRAGD